MGWTSKSYRKQTSIREFTPKVAYEFITEENRAFDFSMFHLHLPFGSNQAEIYTVMRHREKMKTFICCTIVTINKGEIYWKDIEESMAPAYYNCPAKFFNFVKSPNTYADQWRAKCRRKNIKFIPISKVA